MHSEFSEFYQRNKKRWMGAGCWVLGRVLDNDVNDDAMEKLLPCNEASSALGRHGETETRETRVVGLRRGQDKNISRSQHRQCSWMLLSHSKLLLSSF